MNEITQIEEVNGTQPENIRRKLLRKQLELEKAKGNNFRTHMGMKSYNSKTQLEHRFFLNSHFPELREWGPILDKDFLNNHFPEFREWGPILDKDFLNNHFPEFREWTPILNKDFLNSHFPAFREWGTPD